VRGPTRRTRHLAAIFAALLGLAPACGDAGANAGGDAPAGPTVDDCGIPVPLGDPPERAGSSVPSYPVGDGVAWSSGVVRCFWAAGMRPAVRANDRP
jgi:hypothetical protein